MRAMDMTGEYRIPAPRQQVWEALNDPETLRRAIDGCEELKRVGDNQFEAKVTAKVGPVKARFGGKVTLEDLNPPTSYRIVGEGSGGAAGFAKGGAAVHLSDDGDGTILRYEAKADVGGKLAQIGSRLISGTAKKMADEFFGRFSKLVVERAGGTPAVAAAAPVAASAAAPVAPVTPAATTAPVPTEVASATPAATPTAPPGDAPIISPEPASMPGDERPAASDVAAPTNAATPPVTPLEAPPAAPPGPVAAPSTPAAAPEPPPVAPTAPAAAPVPPPVTPKPAAPSVFAARDTAPPVAERPVRETIEAAPVTPENAAVTAPVIETAHDLAPPPAKGTSPWIWIVLAIVIVLILFYLLF